MKKIGNKMFLDTENIPKEISNTSFEWRTHRDQGLQNSESFFLILTGGFIHSNEIKSELNQAIDNNLPMYFFKHKSLPWNISIELNRKEFNFGKYNLTEFETKEDLIRSVLELFEIREEPVLNKAYSFKDTFEDSLIGEVPIKWSVLRQNGEIFVQNGVSMNDVSNYLVISCLV